MCNLSPWVKVSWHSDRTFVYVTSFEAWTFWKDSCVFLPPGSALGTHYESGFRIPDPGEESSATTFCVARPRSRRFADTAEAPFGCRYCNVCITAPSQFTPAPTLSSRFTPCGWTTERDQRLEQEELISYDKLRNHDLTFKRS
jgi:hypothetical protein